jgi:hypothetical protein
MLEAGNVYNLNEEYPPNLKEAYWSIVYMSSPSGLLILLGAHCYFIFVKNLAFPCKLRKHASTFVTQPCM